MIHALSPHALEMPVRFEKLEEVVAYDGNEGTIRGLMFGVVVALIVHGT
jgi:hypothetical protein